MASSYKCALIYAGLANATVGAQTITVANGYENAVGSRVHSLSAVPPLDVLGVMFKAGAPLILIVPGGMPPLSSKGEIEWDMGVEIRGVCASGATPVDAYWSLVGDCIKWIHTKRTEWHSSVVDTTILSVVPWGELTKPHAGFVMSINIRYCTTVLAP